jgi:transaldolase
MNNGTRPRLPLSLKAFANHGDHSEIMSASSDDCEAVLDQFAVMGVDIDDLAAKLQNDGAKSFMSSWNDLMGVIASKTAILAKAG